MPTCLLALGDCAVWVTALHAWGGSMILTDLYQKGSSDQTAVMFWGALSTP